MPKNKRNSDKMALLLTKRKSWTGLADVDIHNGCNTHVNQGVDPLDHKHDEKRPNSLCKQSRKDKSPGFFPHGESVTGPQPKEIALYINANHKNLNKVC